jgi:hypothetical protein
MVKWRLWKSRSKPRSEIKLTIQFMQLMQLDKMYFNLSHSTIYLYVCLLCDHKHGVTQGYKRYKKYVYKMYNWHNLMLQSISEARLAVMILRTRLFLKTDKPGIDWDHVASYIALLILTAASVCFNYTFPIHRALPTLAVPFAQSNIFSSHGQSKISFFPKLICWEKAAW